ncbi:MAG: hypothetical protein R2764_05615 [Bacteroidales bacterium]
MKKTTFLLFMMLGLVVASFSQIDKMREKIDDADAEEQGLLTIRFFNAENGDPVADATINIQDFKTLTTDAEGKIRFEIQPDGVYPFSFEKQGFISENNKFEVVASTIF